AGTLAGNGIISANGGSGQLPLGGGGGGGRIAISTGSLSNTFAGLISAYGGPGYFSGGVGSVFTLLTVGAVTQGNSLDLIWNGEAGADYQVESSTDLVNWTAVGPPMAGSNGVNSVALPIGTDPGTFFRLVLAN
ncbi:MAG TPA: hypothetical protein VH619_07620, partial [Verrucomicrobiae bacterium]|nr:hypothetical protein [Verrucomicrobiae bacterium]